MTLQATFALAVLSLSVWTAIALLLDRRGAAPINRRFALVIAISCLPQAYFYTQLLEPPLSAGFMGLVAQAAIWLKGPLLLSMVRLVVDRPMSSLWRDVIPFPLALAGMLATPGWELEWGMAGFVAMLGYLLIALRDLRRGRPRLSRIYSAYPNSAYYWLIFVVAGLMVLVSTDLVLMALAYAQRAFPLEFMKVANWLVGSYLVVIAFCSVYRPRLFFHEDRAEESAATPTDAPAETSSWRELDESLARTLSAHLSQLMERERLYRRHELSLADLAGHLGVSPHQASELLNVHHRMSFYEFLNRHRLEHARGLLADPRCELRVLDIAFEAGFGNKNSFYRSFREAFGMTPVEYRRRQLEGGGIRPAAPVHTQSQKPS